MRSEPIRDITLHKPRPRLAERIDDLRIARTHKRAVEAAVDARDARTCQLCGRRGDPFATDPLFRLHRAHVRNASQGGPFESWNLTTLCGPVCHLELVHGQSVTMAGNPDKSQGAGALKFTITAEAAARIFRGRDVPPHVRVRA